MCRRLMSLVPRIHLYTTLWCGYCLRAKALLDARGLRYEEISLDEDPAFRQVVFDLGRRWTVPLVLIDGEPIGGYDELAALDRSGLLAERLAA
jgi:glutaredoxin 3